MIGRMSEQQPHPTPQEARVIAAVSQVHPQTIGRYFAGTPGKPTTRERIEEAIVQLGYDHLLGRERARR